MKAEIAREITRSRSQTASTGIVSRGFLGDALSDQGVVVFPAADDIPGMILYGASRELKEIDLSGRPLGPRAAPIELKAGGILELSQEIANPKKTSPSLVPALPGNPVKVRPRIATGYNTGIEDMPLC